MDRAHMATPAPSSLARGNMSARRPMKPVATGTTHKEAEARRPTWKERHRDTEKWNLVVFPLNFHTDVAMVIGRTWKTWVYDIKHNRI